MPFKVQTFKAEQFADAIEMQIQMMEEGRTTYEVYGQAVIAIYGFAKQEGKSVADRTRKILGERGYDFEELQYMVGGNNTPDELMNYNMTVQGW